MRRPLFFCDIAQAIKAFTFDSRIKSFVCTPFRAKLLFPSVPFLPSVSNSRAELSSRPEFPTESPSPNAVLPVRWW